LTNLQETGFRAFVRCEGVELVVTHGSQKNGVGLECGVKGRGGQRRSACGDGDTADQTFYEGEIVAAKFGDGAQDICGFAGNFRADAVAGEDCNFETHSLILLGRV
jgi:hypothetical protein